MLWPCTIYTWPLMSAKMWCPCGQLTGILTPVNCIVPLGFLPWGIQVAFPGESKLWQSHATQPTVYAGCFSVSIIHQTLTWTRGSLTCTQMLMHVIAHEGVQTHERDSSLKVDSGRKIPCRTGESNLRQRRDGPMLLVPGHQFLSWQLSKYSLRDLRTALSVSCTSLKLYYRHTNWYWYFTAKVWSCQWNQPSYH